MFPLESTKVAVLIQSFEFVKSRIASGRTARLMLISELALHLVHIQNLVPGERNVGIDIVIETLSGRLFHPKAISQP